jgi:uncharacterized membrane protein YphA (DoxX/SURF4 family)
VETTKKKIIILGMAHPFRGGLADYNKRLARQHFSTSKRCVYLIKIQKMKLRGQTFQRIDNIITNWMATNGIFLLRISIGIIFFWFGILKYFNGLSPAEDIAVKTINVLSFNMLPEKLILYTLATWEVLIGVGLLLNLFLRETLLLLYLQMLGTFTPLFLFPAEVFNVFPYSLTLEGQYIVKNLVIVSAGIIIGATVRGARIKIEEN